MKHQKKYVTIDSAYDSYLAKYCEVLVVSHEYLDWVYQGKPYEELMDLYVGHTDGLVIFTRGEKPLMYARRGKAVQEREVYPVAVASTLGAGDSFKACMQYPIAFYPPTQERIKQVMDMK